MATGQVLFQRFFYTKSFVKHSMEVWNFITNLTNVNSALVLHFLLGIPISDFPIDIA